jgi:hypothetical protein
LRKSSERYLRTHLSENEADWKKDPVGEENLLKKGTVLKSINEKPLKIFLIKLRRRPAFGVGSKSPACRIINCRRNKDHKCCQEKENTEPDFFCHNRGNNRRKYHSFARRDLRYDD